LLQGDDGAKPRVEYAGAFYNGICCGHQRQVIFRSDADREYHLDRDWKSFGNAMPLRFILMCGCIVISSIIAEDPRFVRAGAGDTHVFNFALILVRLIHEKSLFLGDMQGVGNLFSGISLCFTRFG
jgi:hypothetical protein